MLASDLDSVRITENSYSVQHVDGELLSQRVWRIAHYDAHAEVAKLRIFSDCAGAQEGLGQATSHESDRVLSKSQVLRSDRG